MRSVPCLIPFSPCVRTFDFSAGIAKLDDGNIVQESRTSRASPSRASSAATGVVIPEPLEVRALLAVVVYRLWSLLLLLEIK